MEKQLMSEIKLLRSVISELIGTSDLPIKQQFSKEALDKAAKDFRNLSIERGDWVSDSDINKYIKNASYRAGKFIIEEFKFTNYFRRGHTLYLNKKSLLALGKELKSRNIDLGRYIEFRDDQDKFQNYLVKAKENKKLKKRPYEIEDDVRDITTSAIPNPSAHRIRDHIKQLKEQFFKESLSDYIDIYKSNYAVLKSMYYFEKYLEPGLKSRCRKWCEDFNYANKALQLVTKKKDTFIPVPEDVMIQL